MKRLFLFTFIAVLLSGFCFSYDSAQENTDIKYYDNAKVVKVKYKQGDTYIKRSFDEGAEEAGVNIPVFENDIAGTNDGRLDIYLGRSNFLRLDFDTEVEFKKVPRLRKTELNLILRRGGIYLDIHNLDYEKGIEVQTPDCGVFLLSRGIYRINFNGPRGTEVFVYDGIAEVAGTSYSRNIRENQKVVMRDGDVRERPFYFYSTEKDDFDIWNEKRHNLAGYARSSSSRYLDSGYEDQEYDLSRSGRWRYNSTYRTNIWIPYNVGSGWSPYYNGRWIWTPHYGYYWYSYDSWGSYTYHHGRWHWDTFWGWYWIPGYRWSPGWVSWCYSGNYWGWSPLSYYNRPVIVINKRWLRNHNYRRGIPLRSRSTIVVRKGDLGRSVRKVALKKRTLLNSRVRDLTYRGASPRVRPKYNHVGVVNSKGKTVVYKKSGMVSTKSYRALDKKSYKGSKGTTVYKYKGSPASKGNSSKYSSYKIKKSDRYKSTGSTTYKKSSTGGTTYRKVYRTKGKSTGSTGYRTKSTTKKYVPTKVKKSSTKKKTSSSTKKVKKKKSSPSYSYNGNSSSQSYRSNKYYSSKSSGSTGSGTYSSGSSNKYYKPYSYKSSSYKSKSYKSGSSYKYSKPSTYKSSSYSSRSYSPRKSSSYKSYSPKRSSSSSSRSYSSSRSSRSSSSSSRSYKSSSSSSGSSSKSYKKK
ncbi:MAG: DUF6600 domain-containing protein [Acidobacteriota bacterium]